MTTNTVILKACNGQEFIVPEPVAMEMNTVKLFLEEVGSNSSSDPSSATTTVTVPLYNVSSHMLALVIDYVEGYLEAKVKPNSSNGATKAYAGKRFLKNRGLKKDVEKLKEMCLAANYLDIKHLEELTCQAIADKIKNKGVEYVREFFGIENDFTKDEEERLRKEYAWAHEDVNDEEDEDEDEDD